MGHAYNDKKVVSVFVRFRAPLAEERLEFPWGINKTT
jgi:hypothetical protein